MGQIGRRRAMAGVAAALTLTATSRSRAAAVRGLVYGDTTPVAPAWPTMIAQEAGLFTEAGLRVETVYTGNNVYVVQQIVGGSLDVGATTFDSALRGILAGAPILIIGSQMLTYPFSIIAASSVTKLEDLSGKRVILPFASSPLTSLLDAALRERGIDPGKVEKVFDGATPNRLKALLSGAVAAAALTQPSDITALGQGYIRVFDYAAVTRSLGFDAFIAKREWLQANGDAARAFLRATASGVGLLYDPAHRQAAIDALARSAKIDVATVAKVYDYYVHELKPFSPTLAVPDEAITHGLAQLGEIARSARGRPISQFADLRYLPG